MLKHLDELAKTAEILARQGEELLALKHYDEEFSRADDIGRFLMRLRGSGRPDESRQEPEHLFDPYLAKLLYVHYVQAFDKPPFKEWNKLSRESVGRGIVANLTFLAHGALKACSDCPICQIYTDIVV